MESLEEKQHVGIKIFRPSRINLITRNERSRQVAPRYFANQQSTRHETIDKISCSTWLPHQSENEGRRRRLAALNDSITRLDINPHRPIVTSAIKGSPLLSSPLAAVFNRGPRKRDLAANFHLVPRKAVASSYAMGRKHDDGENTTAFTSRRLVHHREKEK